MIGQFAAQDKYIMTSHDLRGAMSNRFVVQEHTTLDGVHWDLMLEKGEALATWRLEQPPQAALDGPVQAVRIFDHSPRFLTYEGPVQKGTGRVRIVDRGTSDMSEDGEDAVVLDLQGEVLQGSFLLKRVEGRSWQLEPRP
jgi:hypothetical protein